MRGQVQRDNRKAFRQRVNIEKPITQVAAKAMQQHQWHALFGSAPRIAHPNTIDLRIVIRGTTVLVVRTGDRHLKRRHECINFRVANLGLRHHAQQPPHRECFTRLRDTAPEQPSVRGFNRIAELIGFHIQNRHANMDTGSHIDQPIRNGSLAHFEAPFGHDDRRDG